MDIVTIRIENVQIFLNENLFTDKLLNKNYHILNNWNLKKFYFCSLLTFQGKKLSGLMWDNFKKMVT